MPGPFRVVAGFFWAVELLAVCALCSVAAAATISSASNASETALFNLSISVSFLDYTDIQHHKLFLMAKRKTEKSDIGTAKMLCPDG
jgi:hypothetical protein